MGLGFAQRRWHPLAWVPSAYLAEGIPFAIVIWVAGTLLKDLGYQDGEITVATASIGIAWSLKPLWASVLDMWRTKKFFVLCSELVMAAVLGATAFLMRLPGVSCFELLIPALWVLAFCSATQDICVDGIYITALDNRRQAAYVGLQGTAWQAGRIFATAALVWVAGTLQVDFELSATAAWSYALALGAGSLAALAGYHALVLPTGGPPAAGGPRGRAALATFVDSARDFLRKPQLLGMLLFVFLFRSGEGLLLVEAPLFLQAPLADGGLGLSLTDKGLIDGTISTGVSVLGGILGGLCIARYGLRRSLFAMALAMNLPHLAYVALSQWVEPGQPLGFLLIASLVSVEKFGYSFASVANMLYMMQQIAPGNYPMTHYAFCTALMNLVLVPTQMLSGPLADAFGYRTYFLLVVAASFPSIVAAWYAPFPRSDPDAA